MENKNEDKINVIYIVGYNHSGTTLVSKFLGISKNAFNIGEINHFKDSYMTNSNKKIIKKGFTTKEGHSVKESPFWKPISENINSEKLLPLKMSKTQKIIFFIKILLGLRIKNSNIKEEEKLYDLILNQVIKFKPSNNKDYHIVESSKSLFRLANLVKSKKINLEIIHVTRDCRGVANSYKKRNNNWFLKILENLFTDLSIKLFIKKNGLKYTSVYYDEFAKNPKTYLKKFQKKFNLEVDEKNYLKQLNTEQDYTFSGNPMRRKEIKEVKVDTQWRENFRGSSKIILNFLYKISIFLNKN